jgi:hypothetical protein
MTSYVPTPATISQGGSSLVLALERLEHRLQRWAAEQDVYTAVLEQVFGLKACGADAESLRHSLLGEGLGLSLELATLEDMRSAYAVASGSIGETVFLDGAWLMSASVAEIEAVLLEKLGHAIDQRLNEAPESHRSMAFGLMIHLQTTDLPTESISFRL